MIISSMLFIRGRLYFEARFLQCWVLLGRADDLLKQALVCVFDEIIIISVSYLSQC
jgi:hypothetical protein